jgi:hypothetical protein
MDSYAVIWLIPDAGGNESLVKNVKPFASERLV